MLIKIVIIPDDTHDDLVFKPIIALSKLVLATLKPVLEFVQNLFW